MSGEEWERVKTVFEAALAVSDDARTAFLKEACSSDHELYVKVIDLLRNYSASPTTPPRASARIFQTGDLVAGRFRVVRFVDSGGMGEVYEVVDERLGLRTALKTLRSELAADDSAVARFRREIRVARQVAHQNLCKVYEFVEHRGPNGETVPCITMEFIHGETLADCLLLRRPLSCETALPLIRQIAAALDSLHAQNILHRDLKPSNVMLEARREGEVRVVVMDFGLAKGQNADSDLFESSLHFQVGAPYFMAPELLRGERPTVASDIYALGLIIDEMVTRTRAFSASSMQALYYAKLWEEPQSPGQRSVGLPEQWTHTILRCLDKHPPTRFSSAGEVVNALSSGSPTRARAFRARKLTFPRALPWVVGGLSSLLAIFWVATLFAQPFDLALFDIENKASADSYAYLARGLTAELTRRLAESPFVRITPMRHIHAARQPGTGQSATVPGQLPARFSLDGQLTPSGNEVALTVAMHDQRRGGAALWVRQFSSAELHEPIGVEAAVVEGVLGTLESTPTASAAGLRIRSAGARAGFWRRYLPSAESSGAQPFTSNRALDDLMRGRQLAEQQSPDSVRSGIQILHRAISEEPSFGLAYAALANASFTMMNWNYTPQQRLLSDAEAYAQTAVTVSPQLPEAHEARAMVYQHKWEWDHARRDYLEALRLKPTFALARRHYAVLLTQMGDVEQGVAEARRAFQDDPYDQSALPGFGLILYISGRRAEAVRVLDPLARNSMAASQNLGETYALLALASSGKPRQQFFQKALDQVENVRQIESHSHLGAPGMAPNSDRLFAQFYALIGDHRSAESYLPRLNQELGMGAISPAEMAWVYAGLGRKREALDLLERAADARDRHMLFLKVYPFVDSLRAEPRFQAILAKMHFDRS